MNIVVVFDREALDEESARRADPEGYGPNRRACDFIDGDRNDCLLIWHEIRDDDTEGYRVVGSGAWENVTLDQAKAFIEAMGDGLA